MSDRELHERYINATKEKFGVDRVWSYSQVSLYDQDPYEWFLKYILKEPSDKTTGNAYGIYGNMVHDIMEDYYNGKIKRRECRDVFEKQWDKLSLLGLKFNYTNEDSEKKLKEKYKEDLYNFFDNFDTFAGSYTCEMPIAILIEQDSSKEGFFGYIDFLDEYEENGHKKYHIIDYKTSTMYKGKAIQEHARQLLLYAMGLKQKTKCNYEDIDVGWNFLKYVTVKEEQKNGKTKERYIERCELIPKLKTSIDKWLKEYGYDPTFYDMITSLEELPIEVCNKFHVEDCIITVPFTKESADMLTEELILKCKQLRELTKKYEETHDENLFMWEPTQNDEFWLYNLCSYSSNLHKPFANYLHKKELVEQYYEETPWLEECTAAGDELMNDFFKSLQSN